MIILHMNPWKFQWLREKEDMQIGSKFLCWKRRPICSIQDLAWLHVRSFGS